MDEFSGSLGLRSISSYLKQRGYDVKIIFLIPYKRFDCGQSFSTRILEELAKVAGDSDIIGISSMTDKFKKTSQVIDYLKKLDKLVVWGGFHATSCPDECIEYADAVCIGEGEEAFHELIEALEKKLPYFDIKNFWFKYNNQIIKNSVRPLIADLNSLPPADFEADTHYVLDNNVITKAGKWYEKLDNVCMHTARGCPNACSYCFNSFLRTLYHGKGSIVRKTSMEVVLRQLKSLKSKLPSLKFIWFTDDIMFIRTSQELKLFAAEYKETVDLPFQCYVSPNTIDEKKLELLIDAGLAKLEMGIQTGSEKVNRDLYNRNISNAAVIKASQIISRYKKSIPELNYQVIFCNPYESGEDLTATISLLLKLSAPFYLQTFILQFFPASALYARAKCDGLLDKEETANYNNYSGDLKLNANEIYLNFLVSLLNGRIRSKIMGDVPRSSVPLLINRKVVDYFNAHSQEITALIKYLGKKEMSFRLKLRRCLIVYRFILRCIFIRYFIFQIPESKICSHAIPE